MNMLLIRTYTFPELCEKVFDSIESGTHKPADIQGMLKDFLDENREAFLATEDADQMAQEWGERVLIGALIHTLQHYKRIEEIEAEQDGYKWEQELQFSRNRIYNSNAYKIYRMRESGRKKDPLYAIHSLIETACNVTDVAEVYQAKEALENLLKNR